MSQGPKSRQPDDRLERDAQMAAALSADVGVEHVATIYAEAFLGAAQSEGQTEQRLAEFDSLLADVLDVFPDLERVLVSGLVSHEDKVAVLDRTLGGQASPLLLNFLKVVSHHGRLEILRPIHREARKLFERMQGWVRVLVTTATPLDDPLAERVVEDLRRILPGKPILERRVDPSIIAGIVVRVGDTVYDGSVATQLETLRQQMIDRSAHEIQSRRNRFRYPD
jgi:F-type H+-transporting ATPase subunit delta